MPRLRRQWRTWPLSDIPRCPLSGRYLGAGDLRTRPQSIASTPFDLKMLRMRVQYS